MGCFHFNQPFFVGAMSRKEIVIGFHIALTKSWSSSGNVAFDRVILNYGNCWSTKTHRFTAPTKGFYLFILNIMNGRTSTSVAALIHGGAILQRADSNGMHDVGTASALTILHKGDHVHVESFGGVLYSSSSLWTHFVGFLIHKIN